jgi:phosphoribosylformylglycinamidine synthase
VRGCCDAAHHHRAPFVSGKDSLNNEYLTVDGSRHAIPPTLVITAVAPVPNVAHVMTPDLKAAGNVLVVLGRTLAEFGGSHLAMVLGDATPSAVPAPDADAATRYWRLHEAITHDLVVAAHDCSEGGIAVALSEMCIGGRLGADVNLTAVDDDPTVAMFSESTGRIICEVPPQHLAELRQLFGGDATIIGHVTDRAVLDDHGRLSVPLDRLVAAFHRTDLA